MIRDAVKTERLLADIRRFVSDVAIPHEAETERDAAIPTPVLEAGRALGCFGWSIPEEFGGAGMTTEELALAFIELSRAAVAYRVVLGTNAGVGSEALVRDGTAAQKQRYLPQLASGQLLGCLALTEDMAGSDAASLGTTAERTESGWVINGSKRYITMAPMADLFTVFARTDPAIRGSRGVSAFLVDRNTPGVIVGEPTPMMGQAGAPISELRFDNCHVHADALLGGEPGQGFVTVMKALNKQRINLAALCLGPAIRLFDEALGYARTREQFGQPIGEFQLVQAMLAQSKVEIESTRALILQTARKRDRGEDVVVDVSMCKYLASEVCGRVADTAVQIFGGAGYVKGAAVERFYRDVRVFRIYEGTSQIHLLNIGKRLVRGA